MTNDDLILPKNPTLKDYQEYVDKMEHVRGFTEGTILQRCLQLVEEVGELCKSIRKAEGMQIDSENSRFGELEHEMADVMLFLCAIANRYNVNLEDAFREKEELNKKRTWK